MTDPAQDFKESFAANEADSDAVEREARNGLRHIGSLGLSKVAGGLTDPRLIMSWFVLALGAPAWIAALVVPVREGGTLAFQPLMVGWVQGLQFRKFAWVVAVLGQGLAVLLCAMAAWFHGLGAGLFCLVALGLMSGARALGEVSYKEALRKTIPLERQSTVGQFSGGVGAMAVLLFSLLLMIGMQGVGPLSFVLTLAGFIWLAAGGLFSTLDEPPTHAASPMDVEPLLAYQRPGLRRRAMARGLLGAMTLSLPLIVILSGVDVSLRPLGVMLFASAMAFVVSAYAWRRYGAYMHLNVFGAAGFAGAAVLLLVGIMGADGAIGGWGLLFGVFLMVLAEQAALRGWQSELSRMSGDGAPARDLAYINSRAGGVLIALGVLTCIVFSVAGPGVTFGMLVVAALGGGGLAATAPRL